MIGSTESRCTGVFRRGEPRSATSASIVPSTVVPSAVSEGQEERVPGDAAAHPAGEAAQAPGALVAEPLGDGGEREPAGVVDEGAGQRHRHRQGDEQDQQGRAQHHGAGDEGIAAELARAGEAAAAAASAARAGSRAPPRPRPGWPAARAPNAAVIQANDQPFAPMEKPLPSRPARPTTAPTPARRPRRRPFARAPAAHSAETEERDPEPGPTEARGGAQAAGRVVGGEHRPDRVEQSLVGREIPRQEGEAGQADAAPGDERRPHPVTAGGRPHRRSM